MPPLGLLYIGAILEKEGHEVQIVPADLLKLRWSQVAGVIRDFEPDLIGLIRHLHARGLFLWSITCQR